MQLYPREVRADITIEDLTLFVHYSGKRPAIRMLDKGSAIRRNFSGLRWYPVDDAWRVPARFVPHDEPIEVKIQNTLGDIETVTNSGTVRLQLAGEELEMLPVDAGDQLWFIFRDRTSGSETYAAARSLYADAPGEDGRMVVDFNRACNSPRANRLPVRVEAGELDYRPTP